jgi:hypothetical protein
MTRGRVVRSLKGAHGSVLDFGYYKSYQPGERYMIFLTKPGRSWGRLDSTNSWDQNTRLEYRQSCAVVHTANEVMQFGLGALAVERPLELGGERAVRVMRDMVTIPADLPCREVQLAPRRSRADVWVPEARLVDFLRSLGAGDAAASERAWGAEIRFHNQLPFAVVLSVHQHRFAACDGVFRDQPAKSETIAVEAGRDALRTFSELAGWAVVWSVRAADRAETICEGIADLTRSRPSLRIELASTGCAAP